MVAPPPAPILTRFQRIVAGPRSLDGSQTKSAIGYAKWSLTVSAIALVISAGAAVSDRIGSADDSAEETARGVFQLSELTQLTQRLDEQGMLQRQSIEVARQDVSGA